MPASVHADSIRQLLSGGPLSARQLIEKMGISQPTLSRVLAELPGEVVRTGAARSIHYALRDTLRGLPDISVYRVDVDARIHRLGQLLPVRPEGFVMCGEDGTTRHSDGLPWWLFDMRPQGYLGRAWAARHGADLGLPARLTDWNDRHALRALLAQGHDWIGNLLLGDRARERFLALPEPETIPAEQQPEAYVRLANEVASGDLPGSSAGGEQPKFTAYAMTPDGLRQVLVKFSEAEESPVSERWRDLLLAEHLALETLRQAGIPAAKSRILDHAGQRFLQVERFDRVGALGRRALFSLAALDAEFVGAGSVGWPVIAQRLAAARHIRVEAAAGAELLWAYGSLIGNTDMHNGNLSFLSDQGRPYELAPAYDMTPMAFAPRSSGGLPESLPPANLNAAVPNVTWRQAEPLARAFVGHCLAETRFSARFGTCIAALAQHLQTAGQQIERLG